jgi:hypothetical protein
MLRKLLLPIAAAALLAGCVTTAPYGYRGDGQGDYYYGRPSVEYRHHGVYPGYGYPYHGPYRSGFYGRFGFGYPYGYYGHPYYRHPYYGSPYYGNPYYGYPRPIYRPRPTGPDTRPDGGAWRQFDRLRRRDEGTSPGGSGPAPTTVGPTMPREPRAEPRMRRDEGGSRMGEMIRRAGEGRQPTSAQDE